MATIKSLNLGSGSDADVEFSLDVLLREGADAICCQEGSDRKDVLARWAKKHGWHYWYNKRLPGAAAVPILYRPGLGGGVKRRFSRIAVPRMYVGAGAGPSWSKAKVVTGLVTRQFTLMNTHMVASATRQGRKYRFRRAHYFAHVKVLSAMVVFRSRGWRKVILVGDFNAEEDFYLLAPLRKRMKQWVDQHTMGKRTIDLIWTIHCNAKRVFVRTVISDHRSVSADV
jgi:exonuclease III